MSLKEKVEAEFKKLIQDVESIFGKNNSVTQHIANAQNNVLTHVDNHTSTNDTDNASTGQQSASAVGAISTGDVAAKAKDDSIDDKATAAAKADADKTTDTDNAGKTE